MLYRGPLAIHAARHVEKDACEEFGFDWRTIPRGCIICIVNVENCVQFPHSSTPPDMYGDFTAGRYGFLLRLLSVPDKPIPARGMYGIWNWDAGQGV
jgi:activating signal cointegrator 1